MPLTSSSGGNEILENLTPRWESPDSARTGTHLSFECPLCGPRGGRVKVALANPIDGEASLDPGKDNHLLSVMNGVTERAQAPVQSWGRYSLQKPVACPAGHHLVLQGGMIRLKRHDE